MPYTTTDQHESGNSASRVDMRPLRGLKALAVYLGVSENTAIKFIKFEGLPQKNWEVAGSRTRAGSMHGA